MSATRILLVEDNADEIELTLASIRDAGLPSRVAVARDGVDALDYLLARGAHAGRGEDADPELVLLDLKLPRLDGIEVLKEMRRHQRTRHVPVVVLTSSTQREDLQRAYDHGANSYVRKPVDYGEFARAVRVLGRYWLSLNERPPRRAGPGPRSGTQGYDI